MSQFLRQMKVLFRVVAVRIRIYENHHAQCPLPCLEGDYHDGSKPYFTKYPQMFVVSCALYEHFITHVGIKLRPSSAKDMVDSVRCGGVRWIKSFDLVGPADFIGIYMRNRQAVQFTGRIPDINRTPVRKLGHRESR